MKDRYIVPDESQTRPVEVVTLPPDFMALSDDDALIALGVAYKACGVRTQQCNGQLADISNIGD